MSGYGAGAFVSSLHNPKGEVILGGTRATPTQSATLVIATVTFTILPAAAGQRIVITETVTHLAASGVNII